MSNLMSNRESCVILELCDPQNQKEVTMTHSRCFSGLWIAPVVLATSLLAASTDVRLVNAVKNADKGAIQTLLPQHVDLSATDTDGSTALHWAVRRDDVETAGLLIRGGANVKTANRYGVTPLSLACTNGNATRIEALVKTGADPTAPRPRRG